jgi:hypothetical protein
VKSDEDIERDVQWLTPIVGPTYAEWYAEACRVEIGAPDLQWAWRLREVVRRSARDLDELACAARTLLDACSLLEECGGQRVRDAMQAVKRALWWAKGSEQREGKP